MKFSGLGVIAVLEACKGILALLIAVGLHALAGVNLHQETVQFFDYLHISPTNHYVDLAVQSVDKVTHTGLTVVTIIALGYAVIRFIEAYGLWHQLRWTEWFAFISGTIYLPFEVYELLQDANVITFGVLGINLTIVGYMYFVLKSGSGKHKIKKAVPARSDTF